jgi:uncharacterized protein YkwD
MVANNYFSHTGSDGSSMATRVNATGYAWSSLGENIAAGYSGIDAVLAGWMASDGQYHRNGFFDDLRDFYYAVDPPVT